MQDVLAVEAQDADRQTTLHGGGGREDLTPDAHQGRCRKVAMIGGEKTAQHDRLSTWPDGRRTIALCVTDPLRDGHAFVQKIKEREVEVIDFTAQILERRFRHGPCIHCVGESL